MIIVLVSISFDSIEPEELGLKYDTHKEIVEDNNGASFPQGTQFLGVGIKYLKFPKIVTKMSFPGLPGRTKEGLAINVNMEMSYQLDPKTLLKLFRTFGHADSGGIDIDEEAGEEYGYAPMLRAQFEDILKQEMTGYSAVDFITTARDNVTRSIRASVQRKITPDKYFCTVRSFQMNEVMLAKEFEQSVNDNYMLGQEVKTKELERNRLMVEWNTTLLQERQQVKVGRREAEAEGARLILEAKSSSASIQQKAVSNAQSRIIGAESNARTMIVDAKSKRETGVLDARAAASKMLTEARSKAANIVLEADTYAQTKILQAEAEAEAIKLENDAFVAQYEEAQKLQAESFVKVWEALGKDENKFLELQTLKAVKGMDWKDWTINSDKLDPFDLMK